LGGLKRYSRMNPSRKALIVARSLLGKWKKASTTAGRLTSMDRVSTTISFHVDVGAARASRRKAGAKEHDQSRRSSRHVWPGG
jgi:hypothetical protein